MRVSRSSKSTRTVVYVLPPNADALEDVVREASRDHQAELFTASEPAPVQSLLRQLGEQGRDVAAVCIIGGSDSVPHASLQDETGNDRALLTDNDYGMLAPPDQASRHSLLALPDIPVCRIPSTDPALVARLLGVRDQLSQDWSRGAAVTCAVWERSSAEALRQIAPGAGVELSSSPPLVADDLARMCTSPPGRLFFNVHGAAQSPCWYGEGSDGHPEVLRGRDLLVREDAILVSEACYGASHNAGADSICLAFLGAGGSAFVGSTIIAWGPAAPPLSLADLIVTGTYAALDAGHSLPEALLWAKARIMAQAEEGGGVSPQALNTVSSFCAMGGPLARVRGATIRRPLARPVAGTWAQTHSHGSSGPGDVLGRVRRGMRQGGGGPLGEARQRLAARAARAGWQPVARQVLAASELPRYFRRAAEIQRALHQALGVEPSSITSIRYSLQGRPWTLLVGTCAAGPVTRRTAVVLDASESIRERLFARGQD